MNGKMNVRRIALTAEFKPRINNVTKSCANATASTPQAKSGGGEGGDGGGGGGGGLMSFLSGPFSDSTMKKHKSIVKPGYQYEESSSKSFPSITKNFKIGATKPNPKLSPCAELMKSSDIINIGRPNFPQNSFMGKAPDFKQKETRAVLIIKPQIKVINEAMSNSQKGEPGTGTGLAKVPVKPIVIPQTISTTTPPPLPKPPIDRAPPVPAPAPIPDVPREIDFPIDDFSDFSDFSDFETMQKNQQSQSYESGNISPRMSGFLGKTFPRNQTSIFTMAKRMQSVVGEYSSMPINPFFNTGITQSKSKRILPGKSGNTIFEFRRGYLF